VGLKRIFVRSLVLLLFLCSNRTIVGLKQTFAFVRLWRFEWQQSHHCGIETYVSHPLAPPPLQQQSHHCGIETSNAAVSCPLSKPQQSHHCGIETVIARPQNLRH